MFTFPFLSDKTDQRINFAKLPSSKMAFLDITVNFIAQELKSINLATKRNDTKRLLAKIYYSPQSKVSTTLGGIASICFRFHFKQTLRMHTQGCQGCQKTRNFVRNSKILIARSTIQPKLNKIKNNLPYFDEF